MSKPNPQVFQGVGNFQQLPILLLSVRRKFFPPKSLLGALTCMSSKLPQYTRFLRASSVGPKLEIRVKHGVVGLRPIFVGVLTPAVF